MTLTVTPLAACPAPEAGHGVLRTEQGHLPLYRLDVRAAITGLVARTEVVQGFRNEHDVALEATYVFPLPDRAALTAMSFTAAGREIVAALRERARARAEYDSAIDAGHRAAIAEEDRPDVFTMRVGNIAPGEEVEVRLTLVGPLPYEDGSATYRFPLVVAPRYVPGSPLDGPPAGDGWQPDTDAVPDASRISPPVLLPGAPNSVALSIEATIDPAGFELGPVASSLHAVAVDGVTIRVLPGERVNRDFVLRLPFSGVAPSLVTAPDGTFQLTALPPDATVASRPRDVVLLLDRSGSMGGWKMVAARRAAARIVDTLGPSDRFAVRTFDHQIDGPDGLPSGLVDATDRHRFRAVEHLARVDARGGTELLAPLRDGLALFKDGDRDRVLVLVTDGQVGNEDQIIAAVTPDLPGVRAHTVGIDEAVNAGFLGRLATVGGGRCELVESEDRLDDAMDAIHRRISAPLVRSLRLDGDVTDVSPARIPDLFPGVPLVLRGRGTPGALHGTTRDGSSWTVTPPAAVEDPTVAPLWARSRLRDLEDEYAAQPSSELEKRIVALSLEHSVLCRFTAWVAVDPRTGDADGELHRVIQPVEIPSGWAGGRPMPLAASAAAAPGRAIVGLSFGGNPSVARPAVRRGRRPRQTGGAMYLPPAPAVDAGSTLRDELARLAQVPDSDAERIDALDDLATRLIALVHDVASRGGDTSALQAIIDRIRDESTPSAQRWEQARDALRELTDRPFWKRT